MWARRVGGQSSTCGATRGLLGHIEWLIILCVFVTCRRWPRCASELRSPPLPPQVTPDDCVQKSPQDAPAQTTEPWPRTWPPSPIPGAANSPRGVYSLEWGFGSNFSCSYNPLHTAMKAKKMGQRRQRRHISQTPGWETCCQPSWLTFLRYPHNRHMAYDGGMDVVRPTSPPRQWVLFWPPPLWLTFIP